MAALRTLGISLLAASISFSAIGLMTPGAFAAENMPAQQDTHSEGTAPQNMGSSGWTGSGSHVGKGETTGSSQRSDDSAADQPEMATGQDLNGPPHRFPANNTPE